VQGGSRVWQRAVTALRGIASQAGSLVQRARGKPPASGVPGRPSTAGSPSTPARPEPVGFGGQHEPLAEGQRVYAIGDIHGRADLLENLIRIIEEDMQDHSGQAGIVFLGDYIDRGFQSRQVIDMLIGDRLAAFEICCLKGNHEDALLTFLGDPDFGPRWAAYGGRETLVSYGVRPPRTMTRSEDWHRAHSEFVHALPRAHEQFLQRLTYSARIGPYGFVHAGVRPGVPFEDQSESDLMWIREEFLKAPDAHEVIVVHGHTPVEKPFRDHRRINVDTGAYFSGRLTAARLEGDTVAFLSTKT
jgi:serine/threonine protein phosphatase 1